VETQIRAVYSEIGRGGVSKDKILEATFQNVDSLGKLLSGKAAGSRLSVDLLKSFDKFPSEPIHRT